ncbi:hypothetical protein SGPA1_50590 [Streptomyces misionensis JCM 4497]
MGPEPAPLARGHRLPGRRRHRLGQRQARQARHREPVGHRERRRHDRHGHDRHGHRRDPERLRVAVVRGPLSGRTAKPKGGPPVRGAALRRTAGRRAAPAYGLSAAYGSNL